MHGSQPNNSDDRRIGYSIHYIPPTIRETAFPGATAMVMRGQDTVGHWGADMHPKGDGDEDCLAELDRVAKMYVTAPQDREAVT